MLFAKTEKQFRYSETATGHFDIDKRASKMLARCFYEK